MIKVQLTCTHFALVKSAHADLSLSVGDRTRCEVCNEHRTIVDTGPAGMRIGHVTIKEARAMDQALSQLHRTRG